MFIPCIICSSHVKGQQKVSVAKCGHAFHLSCVEKESEGKKLTCPSCATVVKDDSVIEIRYVRCHPSDCGCGSREDMNDDQVTSYCTICNIHVTDPANVSVAICGHTFHTDCVMVYAELKSKKAENRKMCPVSSCNAIITRGSIIKIQEKKPPGEWELSLYKFMEKFNNPDNSVPIKDFGHFMQENSKDIIKMRKWILQDEDKSKIRRSILCCNKCDRKDKRIETLNKEFKDVKARYIQENKNLKKQNKIALAKEKEMSASLWQSNRQKLSRIVKILRENKVLQKKIKTLKSEASTARAELSEVRAKLSEMEELNKTNEDVEQNLQSETAALQTELSELKSQLSQMEELKKTNEEMEKQLDTLQSQVTSFRDANIMHETIQADLKMEIETLTKKNDEMQTDLETLRVDFMSQYSSVTDLMITQQQNSHQNAGIIQDLEQRINTLKESNDEFRRFNEDLKKENNYQRELLRNIHAYYNPTDTNRRTTSET